MVQECDVDLSPPVKLKYGELEKQSQSNGSKVCKKENDPSSMPKNLPPKGIQFPSFQRHESAERILHTESHLHEGAGNIMSGIKVGHDRMVFPGWLIQLNDSKLNALMAIKNVLASGLPLCDIINELFEAVDSVGVGISKNDVVEVIKRTKMGDQGWSFSNFLLGIGSPHLAREKGVFQAPVTFSKEECQAKNNAEGDVNKEDKKKEEVTYKSQQEATKRLYQPYRNSQEDIWPYVHIETKKGSKKKKKVQPENEETSDITGYTMREKIFFSGLLIFEMYSTMSAVENLYFQSETIPVPKAQIIKSQTKRGFGTDNAGTKKLGFAEWDRPLPPLPKKSPYVESFPLVATRWKIQQPNEEERVKRRTLTTLQPLHLMINAPAERKGLIKVTENRERIKRAMEYLASTGNCVAMLPSSHYIIHLSDTFLQKLEQINTHAISVPGLPEVHAENDLAKIRNEAKKLYLPHGLPPQISKMKFMIPFNCAECLRKICEHIRKEHWEYIQQKHVDFRQTAWDLMRVSRITCGQLRNSFIYSFDTYLPAKPSLPITHNNSMPW